MFARYPRRTILGFSLFIGQAFLYNAITFGYTQILAVFFHVNTNPGYYFAVIAVGNLLGPIGTAAGGISGPLLFSSLVGTGKVIDTVIAFVTGASLMILAGLAEVFLGVKAERKGLEEIASPLTAEDPSASVGAAAS